MERPPEGGLSVLAGELINVRFGHLADNACVQLGAREARNFSLIRWFRSAIRRFSIFAAKNALQ
jgi:hypothetical protein